MSVKPTPRPWKAYINPMRNDGWFIIGANEEKGEITPCQISQANAAHIVKCVNMHEELVEALSGIIEIGKRDMSNPKYDSVFEAAKAVLAKAEAGE